MRIDFADSIPQFVYKTAESLVKAGFEAYLVGGSVRDLLLGKVPNDFDIATNAMPAEIAQIFPKSIPTGAKFGTMLVIAKDEAGENHEIEVTTYRSESDYLNGRWPRKVQFTKTIAEDLSRRDFTINAMAIRLDDNQLTEADIIDLHGGVNDLETGIIRAVGNPVERFSEDGLRSLRACRLAANLGFKIEPKTKAAIKECLSVVDNISAERIREELTKLLYKSPKPSIGFEYLRETGILALILPELLEGVGVTQPEYHSDDVYTHTLMAVDEAIDRVKLAALFHDIGKPRTMSRDEAGTHFYGHDKVGAEMTEQIMKRLKFSGKDIKHTANLVRHHMFNYPDADWRQKNRAQAADELLLDLIIIRHGETEANLLGKVAGRSDVTLTENGKQEIKKLALELNNSLLNDENYDGFADLDIAGIFTSPLIRAKQSAEILAEELNLQVEMLSRLQERDFGELTGYSWAEFAAKSPYVANFPGNSAERQEFLPGAESITAVENRVQILLFNLIRDYAGKTVLIVTHAGVIRVLRRLITDIFTENQIEVPAELASNSDLSTGGYLRIQIPSSVIDPVFLCDSELAKLNLASKEQGTNHPGGWSDGAIRRFIARVGEQNIEDLLALRMADALGNKKVTYNPLEVNYLGQRIAEVRAQEMALKVTDLDINGKDLMSEFQLSPGKLLGQILEQLLEKVIDDPLLNDRSKLLKLAEKIINSAESPKS